MPAGWPKTRRILGTKVKRIDAPEKATGRAKYSYDINRPGMLHAVMLRSPHAHAKIKSIDTTAARKMPGVKAIVILDAPKDGTVAEVAGDKLTLKAAALGKKKEKEETRTVQVTAGVTLIKDNKIAKLGDLKP